MGSIGAQLTDKAGGIREGVVGTAQTAIIVDEEHTRRQQDT